MVSPAGARLAPPLPPWGRLTSIERPRTARPAATRACCRSGRERAQTSRGSVSRLRRDGRPSRHQRRLGVAAGAAGAAGYAHLHPAFLAAGFLGRRLLRSNPFLAGAFFAAAFFAGAFFAGPSSRPPSWRARPSSAGSDAGRGLLRRGLLRHRLLRAGGLLRGRLLRQTALLRRGLLRDLLGKAFKRHRPIQAPSLTIHGSKVFRRALAKLRKFDAASDSPRLAIHLALT